MLADTFSCCWMVSEVVGVVESQGLCVTRRSRVVGVQRPRLMPRSHQTFLRPVPTVESVWVMLRNRCWPITFSRYYNWGCRGMVSQLAIAINLCYNPMNRKRLDCQGRSILKPMTNALKILHNKYMLICEHEGSMTVLSVNTNFTSSLDHPCMHLPSFSTTHTPRTIKLKYY